MKQKNCENVNYKNQINSSLFSDKSKIINSKDIKQKENSNIFDILTPLDKISSEYQNLINAEIFKKIRILSGNEDSIDSL